MTSSALNLVRSEGKTYISKYKAGELTEKCRADNFAKIKSAFPSLPMDFYKILHDRIKESGFSDQRLTDSVNNVIDTCKYPSPTIAQFLSFDVTLRVFTYPEMCKKAYEYGKGVWEQHGKKKINGVTYWYLKK